MIQMSATQKHLYAVEFQSYDGKSWNRSRMTWISYEMAKEAADALAKAQDLPTRVVEAK
jgi:hypothetical protein